MLFLIRVVYVNYCRFLEMVSVGGIKIQIRCCSWNFTFFCFTVKNQLSFQGMLFVFMVAVLGWFYEFFAFMVSVHFLKMYLKKLKHWFNIGYFEFITFCAELKFNCQRKQLHLLKNISLISILKSNIFFCEHYWVISSFDSEPQDDGIMIWMIELVNRGRDGWVGRVILYISISKVH